ncbi:3'(2'),5'-bisphosphate nucleotidase CysQ [Halomonas sp. Bachu 37]|uniref:3'(2'),5'-bisphosphate nucleotidase CysQ n=1 Tax=Halomonas kashgarensis TaxID=3084920 RepID=UPI00321759C2
MALLTVHLLDQVERIAVAAGEAILAFYHRGFSVTAKEDASPVTEADLAANRLILQELEALPPRIPVLSEEDIEAFTGADAAGRFWLVDPLDGTKEFIKRNGEFSVNIALIENGRPVLGVVVAPVSQSVYLAMHGWGAFKSDTTHSRQAIHVAQRPEPGVPWRVLVSRSRSPERLQPWIDALGEHERIALGSSLKLCWIAEGLADVYPRLGPTSQWDTAAAQAVLEMAGGRVETLTGEPLRYPVPRQLPGDVLNPDFIAWGGSSATWQK